MKKSVEQPFRSKAEREMERALAAQYRELGNPDLAAAAHWQGQQRQQSDRPADRPAKQHG